MDQKQSGRLETTTVVAAVLAGLGAAACCLGPLVLAMLGVAGGGLLLKFEPFRPYFIGGAVAALGFGFWLSYRRTPARTGAECECEMPKAAKLGRTVLWVATVVVALLVASPYIIARAGDPPRTSAVDAGVSTQTITVPVEGMTCESCEVTIRTALLRVPGVVDARADANAGNVTVTFRPSEVAVPRLTEAINATGYKAGS